MYYVCCFTGDLLDVYRKFMASEGWQVSMLDSSPGDDGGYKNVVLEVKGDNVYSKLKWEAGVHRVQRVPATETQGRVHTSTATVAIMVRMYYLKIFNDTCYLSNPSHTIYCFLIL